jgi:outer membrane protein TolC
MQKDQSRASQRRSLAALTLLAASLGACTLGPDFEPPPPLPVTGYTSGPAIATTPATDTPGGDTPGGGAQQFVAERDIPREWWTLFQSRALDELVRRALADSPTIDEAEASLRRASEVLDGRTGGTRLPDIDAGLTGVRVDAEPGSVGASPLPVDFPLNLYLASVGISYGFDLFGAGRRELEALQSEVDFEHFELEAARLMLAGNVVTSAIREAALREQIARVETLVTAQERQLSIAERRRQAGAIAELDLLLLQGELAATRATLPALRLQLEQLRHRLAELTGQPPGTATLPDFRLADLTLPVELPLSLP